jgi:type IV fimbrial biogenesis protein FimT
MLGSEKAGAMLSRGFTLLELLITVAVLGIVLMVGLPSLATWIQNTQIRTSAEGMQAGLQLARAEALRRNTTVRFQLVNSVASGCALSTTGTNWVVSLADATGSCDAAASDTAAPQIIQKRSGAEGSPNAVVTATGGNSIWFNGLGRVIQPPTAPAAISQINITNNNGGACKTPTGNEPMRCLRLTVSSGGQVRMCDPAVNDNTDPRFC